MPSATLPINKNGALNFVYANVKAYVKKCIPCTLLADEIVQIQMVGKLV